MKGFGGFPRSEQPARDHLPKHTFGGLEEKFVGRPYLPMSSGPATNRI
jgi:hypothetical protein